MTKTINTKTINDILKDFYFIINGKDILNELLTILFDKNVIIPNNLLTWDKMINCAYCHINSGGYAFIFRLNDKLCLRISTNILLDKRATNSVNDFIQEELLNVLKKNEKMFLNYHLKTFSNKFIFRIFQSYIETYLIFLIIKNINSNFKNIEKICISADAIIKDISTNKPIELYNSLFKSNNKKNISLYFNIIREIYKNKRVKPIIVIWNFENFYSLFKRIFRDMKLNDFPKFKLPKNLIININKFNEYNDLNAYTKILKINLNYKLLINNIYLEYLAYGSVVESVIRNTSVNNKNNSTVDYTKYIPIAKIFKKNTDESIMNNEYFTRLCFLQIFIILYISHTRCGFIHNDLRPENVLVFKQDNPFELDFNNITFIFNDSVLFKINDFDYSRTKNVENICIKRSPIVKIKNIFYDIHYFFIYYFRNFDIIASNYTFYNELYNILIKGNCYICDKLYNEIITKQKIKFEFTEHRALELEYSNITTNEQTLLNFILNSKFFLKWKKVLKN